METYQEEYRKIRREYSRLEKMSVDKELSKVKRDEAQARMAQISGRMNFLRPHVEEAARRIDELTDLRNDITVGRSRLDAMTEIINGHSDIQDMTADELKSIRENFNKMAGVDAYKHLKKKKVKLQIEAFRRDYEAKEARFHDLYRRYEEFEEAFRKEDPLYVARKDDLDKQKDSGNPEPQGVETPEEKAKREEEAKKEEEAKRQEEERKRQEEIGELEKSKKEIEEQIEKVKNDIKKIKDIIHSGKYTPSELLQLQAELQSLIGELSSLQAKLLEIDGKIDALKQVSNEKKEKKDGEKKKEENPKADTKKSDTEKSKDDNKATGSPATSQPEKKENGVAPQAPGETTVYNNGGAVYSPSQGVGHLTNGHNVDVAKAAESVAKDKQLKKKSKLIEKIKETIEKIKNKFKREKEDQDAKIAEAINEQEIAEKTRMKNHDYRVLREEEKRQDADLQLLDFPHARVDENYFYHTVQIDDKIKYVSEPLSGMEFTEEALKRKIIQLQDRYGDEARDRQGKKVYRISNLIDREGKEEQDFWARKSYQQLLKDPDKIIKEYLRGERREDKRREKIIKLMCGLEAANTPQEAGFACLKGLHDDLFDLHGQSAKGPFLSTMNRRNEELMEQHAKKGSSIDKENPLDLGNQDVSQEQSVDSEPAQPQQSVGTPRPDPKPAQPQQPVDTPKPDPKPAQPQQSVGTPKPDPKPAQLQQSVNAAVDSYEVDGTIDLTRVFEDDNSQQWLGMRGGKQKISGIYSNRRKGNGDDRRKEGKRPTQNQRKGRARKEEDSYERD